MTSKEEQERLTLIRESNLKRERDSNLQSEFEKLKRQRQTRLGKSPNMSNTVYREKLLEITKKYNCSPKETDRFLSTIVSEQPFPN